MKSHIMSKSDYTLEDFVLDPEFRLWVLANDEEAKAYWEAYLIKYPKKSSEMDKARILLLNLSRESYSVEETREKRTWKKIVSGISAKEEANHRRIIPLSADSTIRRYERLKRHANSNWNQITKIVAILVFSFCLGALATWVLSVEVKVPEVVVEYMEHSAPAGVKSNLSLHDGSKVILNSESTLKYIKNFEADQRLLELSGEAYFEVAKDSLRPFKVQTGNITTTALGTSFNISAYKDESPDISLVSGQVEVLLDFGKLEKIKLKPGESILIHKEDKQPNKYLFNEERVLGWTQKKIIFDRTPVPEAVRVLENWFGVEIIFQNEPVKGLVLSGKFKDQTLKEVLEGLSYSARFDFKINEDKVRLKFYSPS